MSSLLSMLCVVLEGLFVGVTLLRQIWERATARSLVSVTS